MGGKKNGAKTWTENKSTKIIQKSLRGKEWISARGTKGNIRKKKEKRVGVSEW